MVGRAVAVAVSLVVFGVVVGAPSGAAGPLEAHGCAHAWTVVLQPQSIPGSGQLQGVSASSAADAWTVGSLFTDADQVGHTLTQHFDGTSWSAVASPDGPSASTSALTAVSSHAANDAWAVGLSIRTNNLVRTLVVHWDGVEWSRLKSPNPGHPANGQLNGVAAITPDDVWAVGSSGQGAPSRTLIEHWDGSTWSIVPSPNKGPFPTDCRPSESWRRTTSGRSVRGSRKASSTERSSCIGTGPLGRASRARTPAAPTTTWYRSRRSQPTTRGRSVSTDFTP